MLCHKLQTRSRVATAPLLGRLTVRWSAALAPRMASASLALLHARATSGLSASTTRSQGDREGHSVRAPSLPSACASRGNIRAIKPLWETSSLGSGSGVFGEVKRTLLATQQGSSRGRSAPVSAVATESTERTPSNQAVPSGVMQLTWLENNGWIWELAGVRVIVDPWLVGELDFDIPAFYSAKKRVTADMSVETLPPLDAVLITQSLDDHCHMKTLRVLAKHRPDIPVVAPPSAQAKLEPLFKNLTLLSHGETRPIIGKDGARIRVRATPGDRVGPPWQARENGYIVSTEEPAFSLYYEPHCKFEDISGDDQVDVVITPTVSQKILGYELVSGEERAVELARKLRAKYIVPMLNGDLEASGLLSMVVKTGGTAESFQKLATPEFVVLTPEAGKPLTVPPET